MVRLLTWLLTTPILVVGLFVGHEVGYRVTIPGGHERESALALTHHGYFELAPYLVVPLTLIFLLALAVRVRTARAGGQRSLPSSSFALLPPVAFVVLEASERLLAMEFGTMVSPEVVVGLALQLPFAVAALVVARLLGSLADAVGVALRPLARPIQWISVVPLAPLTIDLPVVRVAALPYGERGPPAS